MFSIFFQPETEKKVIKIQGYYLPQTSYWLSIIISFMILMGSIILKHKYYQEQTLRYIVNYNIIFIRNKTKEYETTRNDFNRGRHYRPYLYRIHF
jgi:hypothetical protein